MTPSKLPPVEDSPQPHQKKAGKKLKPFVVQSRYLNRAGCIAGSTKWQTRSSYATLKQAEQAVSQLNRSHGFLFGPWREFRIDPKCFPEPPTPDPE